MSATRVQYNIGGMSCSFCAESIHKAYERTEGVEEVNVSLAHEEVRIRYDNDTLGEVELKDTLRDLGYTIRARTSRSGSRNSSRRSSRPSGG